MEIEVERLSHWGRVAFAAKCARRVQPFFTRAWPEASDGLRQSIEKAIQLAERSVASGRACDGLAEAALIAGVTAGTPLAYHLYPTREWEKPETPPADIDSAELASLSVKPAEMAANAALASPEKSVEHVAQAYRFTLNAIEHADQWGLIELIELDFLECLRSFPRRPWWKFW
jgi:hypothetical protein